MDAKSLIEEALRELGHEGLADALKWRVNSERTIYSIDVFGVPPDVAKVIREKLEPWVEARMLTLVPKIVKAMRALHERKVIPKRLILPSEWYEPMKGGKFLDLDILLGDAGVEGDKGFEPIDL